MAAFWRLDPFTAQVVHEYGTQNFETILEGETYRNIALRTLVIAALVTVADAVTTFAAGGSQTLPIRILTNLSRSNQRPIVNVAFFVGALSVIPVYLAHRLTSDRDGGPSRTLPVP